MDCTVIKQCFAWEQNEQESLSAGNSPIAIVRHSLSNETQPENGQQEAETAQQTSPEKTSPRDAMGRIQFSLTYDFHDMALNLKVSGNIISTYISFRLLFFLVE